MCLLLARDMGAMEASRTKIDTGRYYCCPKRKREELMDDGHLRECHKPCRFMENTYFFLFLFLFFLLLLLRLPCRICTNTYCEQNIDHLFFPLAPCSCMESFPAAYPTG